jgi:hypothetical protein
VRIPGQSEHDSGLKPNTIPGGSRTGFRDDAEQRSGAKPNTNCPLHYTSGNAPEKRNVLGTLVLSVLAGHWRYAHTNAIRGDCINLELLE